MEWHQLQTIVTEHAFIQALRRGIHPDRIEEAVRHGKVKRFGKTGVKFVQRDVIAVCQVVGDRIVVMTVERKGGRK
ncbi:MAG: hypothetical protein ABIA93_01760 [Candidatus Woesearchaeota archaeon]